MTEHLHSTAALWSQLQHTLTVLSTSCLPLPTIPQTVPSVVSPVPICSTQASGNEEWSDVIKVWPQTRLFLTAVFTSCGQFIYRWWAGGHGGLTTILGLRLGEITLKLFWQGPAVYFAFTKPQLILLAGVRDMALITFRWHLSDRGSWKGSINWVTSAQTDRTVLLFLSEGSEEGHFIQTNKVIVTI